MPRAKPDPVEDVAPYDLAVDLGGGYTTTYRKGESIPERHQGLPTHEVTDLPPLDGDGGDGGVVDDVVG
ncbi:MAG: hypothetical protein WAV00_12145 [Nocardioides sp.]